MKTDIYTIAIKILGLVFVIRFVDKLVMHVTTLIPAFTYDQSFETSIWVCWIIYIFIDLVVAYMALARTRFVVRKLFGESHPSVGISLDKTEWMEVGFAVLGIFAALYALPHMLSAGVHRIYFYDPDHPMSNSNRVEVPLFRFIFQFLLGIFLVMNARFLSKRIVSRGKKDDEKDAGRN